MSRARRVFRTTLEIVVVALVAALLIGGVVCRELSIAKLGKAVLECGCRTAVVMLLVAILGFVTYVPGFSMALVELFHR